MRKQELFDILEIYDLRLMPEKIMDVLFGNSEKREKIYSKLLQVNNNDLSHDWFQSIYEEELAQREQNKQDFTPNTVGVLLSELTGVRSGKIYEPTSGNGSLIIANWWFRKSQLGESFIPSEHPVECWELSDRAIPILLFNLSIRGINAEVYHGDVLDENIKAKYTLVNTGNKLNDFSEIIKK